MRRDWKPQPAEGIPDRLILFDGVCVLCSHWAHFVIARDPAARFRFVAVQDPYGRELARRFGIDLDFPETNAAIIDGRAYFKSDAAIQVLSRLPYWSWVRVFSGLPRRLRNPLYDMVAQNRYRLFGRTDTCLIPTPDLARHFYAER